MDIDVAAIYNISCDVEIVDQVISGILGDKGGKLQPEVSQ